MQSFVNSHYILIKVFWLMQVMHGWILPEAGSVIKSQPFSYDFFLFPLFAGDLPALFSGVSSGFTLHVTFSFPSIDTVHELYLSFVGVNRLMEQVSFIYIAFYAKLF